MLGLAKRSVRLLQHEDVTCVRGLIRVPLIGSIAVCFYHLEDTLIDTGTSSLAAHYLDFFRTRTITQACLTHVHEDHAGMAPWLQTHLAIPIYLHEGDHAEAARSTSVYLYRRLFWGDRAAFRPAPLPPHIETPRYRIQPIPTPGHSPNHTAYLVADRGWLFTGDLYVGPRQRVAFWEESIADSIRTLKEVLKLDWKTLFCAHAGIRKDGRPKLAAKLAFFEDIQGKVLALHNEGHTPEAIHARLFPKKELWERISHGEWSTMRMVKTTLPRD